MVTPCKECTDRFESCHSVCEKYKAWRTDLDTEREIVTKKKIFDADATRRRNTAIAKMQRRKHK